MKKSTAVLAWVAIAAGLAATPAAADGLDCGSPLSPDPKADAALSKAIGSSKLDAGAHASLAVAVRRLKSEGLSRPLIIDHAVAAYCPLVAKDGGLSLDRKREAVRRFAADVTSIVYDPLDPAGEAATAIILSLPVKPALMEQIDVAAARAGQTRDAWMLQAIQSKLTGG